MSLVGNGKFVVWEGETPPYPEVPLPESLRDALARECGIPPHLWPKFRLLAEVCAYCGAELKHGQVGVSVTFYNKPNGGLRALFDPLCRRCSFKAENSPAFRHRLSDRLERQAIALGGLPWLGGRR